jgi:hypothetical protein
MTTRLISPPAAHFPQGVALFRIILCVLDSARITPFALWKPIPEGIMAVLISCNRSFKAIVTQGQEVGQMLYCAPCRSMVAAAAPADRSPAKKAVCVPFSPDAKTLASSGADGLVKLWDVSKIVGPKVSRP